MIPKTLAIDFGLSRVGLAVSYGTLAEPLKIIPHDDRLFATLAQVIVAEGVEQIVVGMSENEMAEKTRGFVEQLKTQLSLPIFMTDETLSSKTTHTKQLEAHLSLSKRQQPIDHLAAAEFLQEWLDEHS
ncbi:MAG TPA: Holliday junction resolvase RuvX [Vitreimonas sp.]|nr:Holliday junction resolvase RuvX [Vitreimonas sp.]